MKLLFDENLSQRLVKMLLVEFPDSTHPELLNKRGDTDANIWEYARQNGFVIVSKDNDFRQKSFLYGHPPKVIWLSIGNAGTREVASLLQDKSDRVRSFAENAEESLLVLELNKAEN